MLALHLFSKLYESKGRNRVFKEFLSSQHMGLARQIQWKIQNRNVYKYKEKRY